MVASQANCRSRTSACREPQNRGWNLSEPGPWNPWNLGTPGTPGTLDPKHLLPHPHRPLGEDSQPTLCRLQQRDCLHKLQRRVKRGSLTGTVRTPKQHDAASRPQKRLNRDQRARIDAHGSNRHRHRADRGAPDVSAILRSAAFSTCVESSSSWRMASRRNADLRALTSTIVRARPGVASFSGIAGDPPPDPMSMRLAAWDGRYRVATSGSRRSRSIASSASVSPVRLILRFQRASSS